MCGNWLQKWGKHRNGKKRYRCGKCGLNSTGGFKHTADKRNWHLFTKWLLGNKSLNEIASEEGVHRITLYRRFLKFKGVPCKPKHFDCSSKVIIIDGVYLGKSKGEKIVVLVARTTTQVVGWWFCHQENYETWTLFLTRLKMPKAIVCDGQRGMLKAIYDTWENQVVVQRCLFHVGSRCLGYLTKKPALEELRELRKICVRIFYIDTVAKRELWLDTYIYWKKEHRELLHKKIIYYNPVQGKKVNYYLHQNAKSVISAIDNALPNMFAYLDYPDIPKTTNHLEGGINSRLKELIYRHRGTSMKNKLVLTARYLRKQQKIN